MSDIALLIQVPTKEFISEMFFIPGALDKLTKHLPYRRALPCGSVYELLSVSDLPKEDLPCPCGKHWFVKYEIDPTLDKRESEKR